MKTILLVEDEVDIAEVLRDVLELAGHRVVIACDGCDGLARAQQQRPDLVVTDLMMPAMDGVELIARVREVPGLERVPVIAISAAPYEGDEPFLRKPFDVRDLVQMVARVLGEPERA